MRRLRLLPSTAFCLLAALTPPACGGGSRSADSTEAALAESTGLTARIFAAPFGFSLDRTPGATGTITQAAFARLGGAVAKSSGFVVGYKENYVDESAPDGVAITVLEFQSAGQANSYFAQTANATLSYAAARVKPYPAIPGAVSADGTKSYANEWEHAVVMHRSRYYASVVYVNAQPAAAPGDLRIWSAEEYTLLGR